MISLNQYWKMLRAHDWHYDFSDDISAYRKGRNSENMLAHISWNSKEHQKLWDCFNEHYSNVVKGLDGVSSIPEEPKEE